MNSELRAISFIATLFMFGRPIAVVGFIISVVVPTFNRVLGRRTWPHIRNEVLKRMKPTVANCDAPCSVVNIFWAFQAQAPAFHHAPNIVFRMDAIGAPSMLGWCVPRLVAFTSAASGMAALNIGSQCNSFISAFATKAPVGLAFRPTGIFKCRQFVEDSASQVVAAMGPFYDILRLHSTCPLVKS